MSLSTVVHDVPFQNSAASQSIPASNCTLLYAKLKVMLLKPVLLMVLFSSRIAPPVFPAVAWKVPENGLVLATVQPPAPAETFHPLMKLPVSKPSKNMPPTSARAGSVEFNVNV